MFERFKNPNSICLNFTVAGSLNLLCRNATKSLISTFIRQIISFESRNTLLTELKEILWPIDNHKDVNYLCILEVHLIHGVKRIYGDIFRA